MLGSTRTRRVRITRGTWRWLLALITILALAMTACGDDDSFTADEMAAEPAADQPATEPADVAVEDTDEGGDMAADQPAAEEPAAEPRADDDGLAVPTALTPADIGREIIYRASISVEVDDVAAAGREAQAIVEGLGGIVFGQETVTEPEPRTTLTFKVLPEDFSTVLDRLAGLGDLVDQRVTADDVTERIVDLESRITTAAASVERLRALLEEAGDVEIIAELENQLLERETTLEVLRGQLRTLRDQVDLATITLTLTPSPRFVPRADIEIAAWLAEGDDDPCLGEEELTVGSDATVHLCIEIENTGEAVLTGIDLDSEELRLRLDDLTIVEGDTEELESRERIVAVATETLIDGRIAGRVATRGLVISAVVTATPVDEQGDRLGEVNADTRVLLIAEEDDALPGFGDAVGGGLDALAYAGTILMLVVGAALPFLPLVAIVLLVALWLRRRQSRDRRVEPVTEDDTSVSDT